MVSEADEEASRGWDSDFVRFSVTPSNAIVGKLRQFLADASKEQVRAWDESVPRLQAEVREIREMREEAARYTAILEYQLPLESRRADAIFLLRESIIVIELKGKSRPSDRYRRGPRVRKRPSVLSRRMRWSRSCSGARPNRSQRRSRDCARGSSMWSRRARQGHKRIRHRRSRQDRRSAPISVE